MTITFNTFFTKLLRLVGDNPDDPRYVKEYVRDGFNAMQLAIMRWQPKLAVTTIASGTTAYAVPSTFYAVESIYNPNNGEIFAKALLSPGVLHGEYIKENNDWLLYPTGYITFSKALPNDYKLIYMSYWTPLPELNFENTTLDIPDFAITAALYYVISYVLQQDYNNVSSIRPYATKVDSGNPEHNPFDRVIRFYLTMFQDEMGRHNHYQTSVK